MAIAPLNFFITTLRAPVLISDTQLQLASGSSAPLTAVASGDFVYLTVSDGTTVEIMKYTSTGSIVADTIIVARGQDNTSAKAFPVGSCVAIGWNVLQIETLISQILTGGGLIIPPDTTVITGDNTVPSGAPATNVIYTVNLTTRQLWYWNGSSWTEIGSNNLRLLAGVPVGVPTGGYLWTFNILTASLFFWDGSEWVLVSANPGYLETFNRQYFDPDVGVVLTKGTDNIFSVMVTAATIPVTPTYFKANNLVVGTILANPDNTLRFTTNALVQISASVNGTVTDGTKNFMARLSIFHNDSLTEYVSEIYYPANTGTAVGVSVTTGMLTVSANDSWDANFVIIDGGGTYTGMTLDQYDLNATVIAAT